MSQCAHITVNRPRDEVERRWSSSGHGAVAFKDAPGDRGTEIHVDVPKGAKLEKVKADLRRFKQQVETGEMAVAR